VLLSFRGECPRSRTIDTRTAFNGAVRMAGENDEIIVISFTLVQPDGVLSNGENIRKLPAINVSQILRAKTFYYSLGAAHSRVIRKITVI